jgi:hypothetical protein
MASSGITRPKREIVSSIEDGPTEYDREKYRARLIEQHKLYVEMIDRCGHNRSVLGLSRKMQPKG